MAKEKTEEKKNVLERTYNVPLRKQWLKSPRWKRSKKAVSALREFISKHMKSENVKIGKYANDLIWKHGGKNPPHHIKVDVTKDSEGKVFAELVGAPKEKPKEKKEVKKEEKGKEEKVERIEDRLEGKKEDKAEEAKKIEKEEIKEMKKEHPKVHAPKQAAIPKRVEQRPTAPVGR